MKKNILLVNSFLMLPLLTSSLIFSAENLTYAQMAQKGTRLPLAQPLNKSGSQKRKNQNRKREQQVIHTQQIIAVATPTIEETKTVIELPMPEQNEQQVTPAEQNIAVVAPTIEETVIELPMPEKKMICDTTPAQSDEVATETAITAKNVSKYVITELTTVETIHAKSDLAKAQSYHNTIEKLDDFLSVIRSINPQANGLRSVETTQATQELSAPAKTIAIEPVEGLEQSVMAPSENKGFGLSDKLWSALSTYRSTIIRLLTNETFDASNATHTEYFNNALEECANHEDIKSLNQILHLCQKEKYATLQSSFNHVAPAFNLLSKNYAANVTSSNNALVTYNQECVVEMNRASDELHANLAKLLHDHSAKVTKIAQLYNAKVDSEQQSNAEQMTLLASLSTLNAKVKQYENALLFEYPLSIPTNSVASIEYATHKKVRQVLTHKNMPQAKDGILQLTNK